MRRVGLRQMNRAFYDEIKKAPFIITKDKKPYLMVIPYSPVTQEQLYPKNAQAGFIPKPGEDVEDWGMEYKGVPIVQKDDVPADKVFMLNDEHPLSWYGRKMPVEKPSLWQRIKNALVKPVL